MSNIETSIELRSVPVIVRKTGTLHVWEQVKVHDGPVLWRVIFVYKLVYDTDTATIKYSYIALVSLFSFLHHADCL